MSSQYDAAIQLLIKARDESGPAFANLHSNLAKTKESTTLASLATSVFSGQAVAGMISQLQTAGRAASEHEAALARLANAVDNNGGSWAANEKQIEANIAANRRFGFSDKDLIDSLNLLTVESGSWETALLRQKVAMDLARGTGMDLYTASRLLGRATDENVGILKRWGIVVEEGASAEELLAKVEERVGNAAEKQTKTRAVQAEVFRNFVTNLYATVGAQSSAIQGLAVLGDSVPKAFGFATTAVSFFTKEIDVAGGTTTKFLGTLTLLKSGLTGLVGVAGPFALLLAALGASLVVQDRLVRKNREEAATTEEKSKAYVDLQRTLRDGGMSYDALAISEYDAARAAEGVVKANGDVLRSINELTTGQQKFRDTAMGPGGAVTAKVSQSTALGALADVFGGEERIPESLVKTIKGIATNTLGLTGAALRKELGDQLYKLVEDSITSPIVKDLESQIQTYTDDPKKLAAAAIEAGKTTKEVMDTLTERLKRAKDEQKILSDELKKSLEGIDLEPTAKADKAAEDKIKKVHEQRDALAELPPLHDRELEHMLTVNNEWGNLISSAKTYGYLLSTMSGRLPSVYVDTSGEVQDMPIFRNSGIPRALGGPMLGGNVYMVGEQNRREAIVMGVGSDSSRDGMGGVTIMPGAIALNYGGAADRTAALRLGSDIIDVVTEGLRQQTRRVGRRASPFGAT